MQDYQLPIMKLLVRVNHSAQPYLLQYINNTCVSVISSETIIDCCKNTVNCFKQYGAISFITDGCEWYIETPLIS